MSSKKMPSGFDIQEFEKAEQASDIGYVRSTAWNEAYRGLIEESALEKRTVQYCTQGALNLLSQDGRVRALVAYDAAGRAAGFAIFGACRDGYLEGCGEVHALYILARTYGSGLGQELLRCSCRALLDGGFDFPIVVWVLEGNARAIRFYEKEGFKPDGATKQLPELGPAVFELRMRKDFL